MHVSLDVLDPDRLGEPEPLAQDRRDELLRRQVSPDVAEPGPMTLSPR
jgi:hypothetical protein